MKYYKFEKVCYIFLFGWTVILSCQQNLYQLCWECQSHPQNGGGTAAHFPLWDSNFTFPSSGEMQCPFIPSNTSHLSQFPVRYISSSCFTVSQTRMSPHSVSEAAYGNEPENRNLRHKLFPFASVLTILGCS